MKLPTRRAGFTLLELMVVVVLLSFLAVLLARLWRGVGRPTAELAARGRLSAEANLAVTALARDLGGSLAGPGGSLGDRGQGRFVGRMLPGNGQLWLCFDGGELPNGVPDWAAPDTVIVYQVQNGCLLRTDQSAGTTFTVARHVTAMDLTDLGTSVQVRLSFSYRGVSRTFTLMVCYP